MVWPYTFVVISIAECPTISITVRGWTPWCRAPGFVESPGVDCYATGIDRFSNSIGDR